MSVLEEIGAVPFRDAEEAWFWYCAALCLQNDGWTMQKWRRVSTFRPCETSDIVRPIVHLRRRGALSDAHLRVLRIYGEQQRVPVSGHTQTEDREAALWREAIALLTPYWRAAGILEDRA